MPSRALQIALVPLDERPVNTGLVQDVARIAGASLVLPPPALLPRFRTPADTEGVADWLRAHAAGSDAVVVALDTLVHGGLIPARTSADDPETAVSRLRLLRELRAAHPHLLLAAVGVVMRASDSYSAVEEPEYWATAGREIHALGGAIHRNETPGEGSVPEPDLESRIRRDYSRRRLRNHVVNLVALELAWDGVIDPLIITADDTARWSAGSAEQTWIEHWQRLRGHHDVLVYPGADETGAVLTARVLQQRAGFTPSVFVVPGDPDGMGLIPSYENVPLSLSLERQLRSAGARISETRETADVLLVIHTPDPLRQDHFGAEPTPDPVAVDRTRLAVRASLDTGKPVALADLRYGNGGDDVLIEGLAADGTLPLLDAYAGWNTAGNALGSLLALSIAAAVGRHRGTIDEDARRRALQRRLVDDVLYQARIRRRRSGSLFGDSIAPLPPARAEAAEAALTGELATESLRLLPWGEPLDTVRLPWRRSFEVDLRFAGDPD